MKNISKKLKISIIFLLVAVILASATVYALFSSTKNYDFELNTMTPPERTLTLTNLGTGSAFGEVIFNNPSDFSTFNVSVANNTEYSVISYKLLLSVTNSNKNLLDKINVYLDGTKVGVVSALINRNNEISLSVNASLAVNGIATHSIKLEYDSTGIALTENNTLTANITAVGLSATVMLEATDNNGNAYQGSTISFVELDDERDIIVKVKNMTTATALGYAINLTLDNQEINDIAYSIVVYLDGKVVGILGSMCSGGIGSIYVDKPLYAGEEATHKVTLRYHNGATLYQNKSITVSVFAEGRTDVNAGKYLIANNADNLVQIIRQNRSGVYQSKTILLVGDGDFTLSQDITVNRPIAIDLNGKNLNLNGHTITFTHSGICEIYSSKDNATITNGTLTLNSSSGLLYSEFDFTITNGNYSQSLLLTEATTQLKKVTKNGLNGNVSLGEEFKYKFSGYGSALSVLIDGSASNVTTNASGITTLGFLQEDYTKMYTLSVNVGQSSKTIPVKVWGSSAQNSIESVVNAFIDSDVPYLKNLTSASNVNYDMLLPTFAGRLTLNNNSSDLTIEWISSRPDLIANNGVYHAPEENTQVELVALFHYNGLTAVRNYTFNVVKMSPQEYLDRYLLGKVIKFSTVGMYVNLPTGNSSIKISSFENPTEYPNMFRLRNVNNVNTVALVSAGEVTRTYLTVKAVVDGTQVSGKLVVKIDLTGTVSISDLAYQYISNEVTLYQMPLCLESINLPAYYFTEGGDQVSVTYSLLDSFSIVGANEPYVNPTGYGNYASVGSLNTNNTSTDLTDDTYGIIFDRNAFPSQNTKIYLRANVSFNNVVAYYPIELELSGIIHNDPSGVNGVADFSLYTEIKRQLDKNSDGYLTVAEALDKTNSELSLTVKNQGITTLKGLELFTQFTSIDLSNNKITDVTPLKNNYSVTKLNLSNNKIQTSDVFGTMVRLRELNLSGNLISNISGLKNLALLENLNLSGTGGFITDFTVLENFTNIKTLNLVKRINTVAIATYYNQLITAYTNATNPSFYFVNTTTKWIPTTEQITANEIINYLSPIYRVTGFMYLPQQIDYNGVSMSVSWSTTSVILEKVDGTSIKHNNGVVTITPPPVDFLITISANITYGSVNISRNFNFTIISSGVQQYVTVNGQLVKAEEAIPDNMLRFLLFRSFNSDADINVLTESEMSASKELSYMDAGINNLTGIELFPNITVLHLENNNLTATDNGGNVIGLSPLNSLSKLTSLYLSNYEYDFSKLTLTTLKNLYVVGCVNIDTEAVEDDLFVLTLNSTADIKIYTQSLTTAWNPYSTILLKQLSYLDDVLVLPFNTSSNNALFLPTTWDFEIRGQIYSATISYSSSIATKKFYATSWGSTTTTKVYSTSTLPAVDTAENLQRSMSFHGSSINDYMVVYCLAPTSTSTTNYPVMVELPNANGAPYSTAKLSDYVKDATLYTAIMNTDSDKNGIITRAELRTLTEITFDGISNSDLLGLQLFSYDGVNSGITTLTLNRYAYKNDTTLFDYSILTSANYPYLKTLNVYYSNIDMNMFKGLTELTNLVMNNCLTIIFDETNTTKGLFEDYFQKVDSIDLANNNLASMYFLKDAHATYIYAYGNPASTYKVNDIYLNQAYSNLTATQKANYSYYVADTLNEWLPTANISFAPETIADFGVTFTPNGGSAKNIAVGKLHSNVITKGTLYLPQTVNGTTATIDWNISASGIINGNTNGNFTVTPSNKDAFVVISGTIHGTNRTLYYQFIVKGDSAVTSGSTFVSSSSLNWSDFSKTGSFSYAGESDQLADNYFAYLLLNDLLYVNPSNNLGVFTTTEVAKLTEFNHSSQGINDIRGIKNLTSLVTLTLDHNSIVDVSELYYLSNLETLILSTNSIRNLWIDTNNSGTINNGDTSVFNQMTKLTTLYINENFNLYDYMAVVYSNKANSYSNPIDSNSNGKIEFSEKVAVGYRSYLDGYSLKTLVMYQTSQRAYEYTSKPSNSAQRNMAMDNNVSYASLRWLQWYDVAENTAAANSVYKTLYLCSSGEINANGEYTRMTTGTNLQNVRKGLIALYNNTNFTNAGYVFNGLDHMAGTLTVNMSASGSVTIGPSTLVEEQSVSYYAIGGYTINQNNTSGTPYYSDGSPTLNLSQAILAKDNPTILVAVCYNVNNTMWMRLMYVKINVSDLASNSYINLNATECGYFGVSVPSTVSETVNGVNYYSIDASALIRDGYLKNIVLYNFDTSNDKVISYAERTATVNTIDASMSNIVDISGIELFPNVKHWNFTGNPIQSIPAVKSTPTSSGFVSQLLGSMIVTQLDLRYCYSLYDITNIGLFDSVKTLTLSDCPSITQDQWQYLGKDYLPNVTSLTLQDTSTSLISKVVNFDFILSLDSTKCAFYYRCWQNGDVENENYDTAKEFYLTSTQTNSIIFLGTKSLIWDYLNIPSTYPNNAIFEITDGTTTNVKLPHSVVIYGTTFTLRYTFGTSSAISNINATYASSSVDDTLSLKIELILNSKTTYTDTIVLAKVGGKLSSAIDQTIWLVDDNSVYTDLQTLLPDLGLREALFYNYSRYNSGLNNNTDSNGKRIMKTSILSKFNSNVILPEDRAPIYVSGYNENRVFTSNIASLSGLGTFMVDYMPSVKYLEIKFTLDCDYSPLSALKNHPNLKTLNILNSISVVDLTPIKEITQLTSINLDRTRYESLNAIINLSNLVTLNGVSNWNAQIFSRTSAVEYAIMYTQVKYGKLGTVSNVFFSDAQKQCALILGDELTFGTEWSTVDASTMRLNTSLSDNGVLTLPSSGSYAGTPYTISAQAISPNCTLVETNGVTTGIKFNYDSDRPYAKFLVKIEYNGACCERMFEVKVNAN